MKKLLIVAAGLIFISTLHAQNLDEIVKKYSTAIKQDQLSKISTIKITGKMSAMGVEMPMTMMMKNPNKIKVTYSFNGQEMVSVFDGIKGYMVNPMMGSSNPVELTGDQLEQVQNNNVFRNEIANYLKNGQLTLEGQEDVKGSMAYKLKAAVGSNPIYLFIDKSSSLLVKMTTTVEQMGTSMNVETYLTDYVDTENVVMPKKTTAVANGMEMAVITFDKIEVNLPMDDSIFSIK